MSDRRSAPGSSPLPVPVRDTTRLCWSFISALLLSASLSSPVPAQDPAPSDSGRISDGIRPTIARVSAIGVAGGTLLYSAGVWWINDYRPFHYTQGPWFDDKLGIDKIGHLFTSYAVFRSIHDILLWGDRDAEGAFWWASGIAAFHGLAVEVGDGYSRYGFDYRDLTFNYLGLAFGMARERVPFLRSFELKWSLYYPMNRHAFKINALYDYHIYWMSVRVHDLLPESAACWWPPFLAVAFGLGADANVTRRTYCVSLDYDLEALLPAGRDAGLLGKLLNLFHLPAPGVKFSKGRPPEWRLFLLN